MPRFPFLLLFLVLGCSSPQVPVSAPAPAGVTRLGEDLAIRSLAPNVLLHTSWRTLPELGRFPSNGLVVLGPHEALLVDTAWGEEPTVALIDYVERELHRRVTHLVVTHSHGDRVGGIGEALRRGVVVHALSLTATRAVAAGHPAPTETFDGELSLVIDGVRAEVFYPGAAHAPDNVVVFLPESRILFGGCMIREAAAPSVGNLEDASLSTWIDALHAIEARFPSPAIVVPGHGEPGDASLFVRTEELVRAAQR